MESQTTPPNCGGKDDDAENDAGQNVPCTDSGTEINVPPSQSCESSGSQFSVTRVLLVMAPILGVLFYLVLPTVRSDPSPRREQCHNNLKCLALAMHHYHEKNGCYPPAFIPDKNGKPMHSWRVLLLPYLDRNDLYWQYRFDEPWDSPNNRQVTDVALAVYRCPTQPDSREPTTCYMMVVGPHTISDGPHSRKVTEIRDGLTLTILLVEVADSGVGWAEPKDLSFDQLDFKINGSKRPGIGSHHSGGANVAFGDGSVRFLQDTTDPQRIRAMLTIDGGEKITEEP